MGFTRTEIRVEVTGAEEGARALENVAAADTRMTAATMAASRALQQQEKAVKQTTNAFGSAVQEIRRYDHATGLVTVEHVKVAKSAQEAGRGIEKMRDEANKAAQPMNAMKAVTEGFGKGLTFLSRAAAILPGFGIAGLLLEIGNAASWVADQFREGEKSTDLQSAALAEYTRIVNDATKAVRELGRAQSEAGRSRIGGALGIDPRALSGESRIQGAQLEAERAKLDERQKALDAQAGEIAAAERSVMERGAALSASAANGVQPGMFGTAASLEAEAKAIGERRRLLVSEAEKLRGAEISLESKVEGLRRAAGLADSQKAGGARGAGRSVAMPKADGPNVNGVWSLGPAAGEDLSPQGIQNVISLDAWKAKRAAEAKAIADQQSADLMTVLDQRNAMMLEHMNAMAASTEPARSAFDTMAGSAKSAFGGMVDDAMNMGGMLAGIAGTITGAFGQMATNMILSGEAGSKGIKKAVANALAGYSAQAFGLSMLLSIAGAAAAATGPIFGWSAPQIFIAAGIAAAGGAALGVAARGLGADMIGQSKGSGGGSSSSGGKSGMASAAGTNPYRSEATAPQPIHIHIGSETVTRVVDGERRREARRDGISAREAA